MKTNLHLYPETFLWFNHQEGILYNCKSKNMIKFDCNDLIYKYCERLDDPKNLYSVEINGEEYEDGELRSWLDFFENEMSGAASFVTILPISQIPIEYGLHVNHYENLNENIEKQIYDFIIIDGPLGTPWHSRDQILEIVQNNLLAENFIIIMDDYDRRGEKQTIYKLYDLLCMNNIPYITGIYSGEKDSIVICSPIYKFVTSL